MKVFFNDKQSFKHNNSISPSAGKPDLIVNHWLNCKKPIEIVSEFEPVTREDFYLAHYKDYVDGVLDGMRPNGFDNFDKGVNATLAWTTGSMLAAAEEALKSHTITCSPTSGFHHAGYKDFRMFGWFCTFNGLIVASELLRKRHGVKKVGILDIDHHFGNGTHDIIQQLKLDYISHYSFGEVYNCESYTKGGIRVPSNNYWRGGIWAEKWLELLPQIIIDYFSDSDIVLYQAGADPHKDDPFGGALTNEQLKRRDKIVFKVLNELNVPVAWNLAGGYQTPIDKVLSIHTNTLDEALKFMKGK